MTKTLSLAAGLAVLLSTAPAWAQSASPGAVQPGNPPAPQQGIATGTPSPTTTSAGSPDAMKPAGNPSSAPARLGGADRTFVKKAALAGMAEIQAGQLAQKQAQSPDVKAFGQMMVADHTAADQKLTSIADAKGASPPTGLDAAGKKQIAALQKQSGKGFDRQYVKGQLTAHEQAVALFKKEAASGSDPQLKQFASDTLPTLQHHLSEVQGLAKK